MNAILDLDTLEIIGAAIRDSQDRDMTGALPDELRRLYAKLEDIGEADRDVFSTRKNAH